MIDIARYAAAIALTVILLVPVAGAETPEIRIYGSATEIIAEYKNANFWGEIKEGSAVDHIPGKEEVAKMQAEIARLRETGELDKILAGMGVDFD